MIIIICYARGCEIDCENLSARVRTGMKDFAGNSCDSQSTTPGGDGAVQLAGAGGVAFTVAMAVFRDFHDAVSPVFESDTLFLECLSYCF